MLFLSDLFFPHNSISPKNNFYFFSKAFALTVREFLFSARSFQIRVQELVLHVRDLFSEHGLVLYSLSRVDSVVRFDRARLGH